MGDTGLALAALCAAGVAAVSSIVGDTWWWNPIMQQAG